MPNNMTQGSITKALLLFSLPLIASGLLQQLYGWVDAFVVGNVVGEDAIAAIGATHAVWHFYVMAITGFTSGVSILSARYCGSRQDHKQKLVLFTFLVVVGLVIFATTIFTILFTEPALRLLKTPSNIFEMSEEYLRIVMLGIPCLAVYNVYSGVLRGIGDSSAPLYSIMVSAVANVALDIYLVAILGYGVKGAALATFISQAAMMVFIVIYTFIRYPLLRFGITSFDLDILIDGSRLALPITIQSMVTAVGNLILQNFMNTFGSVTVAAITTAYRVDSVIVLPIVNLGTGIATIVSQNKGAGEKEREKECLRIGIKMMVIISVILMIIILSFAGKIVAIFGITEEAILIGKGFFRGLAPFYIVFSLIMALRGFLEGEGDVIFSGINGIITLIIRIILSYALCPFFGNMVIAYAEGLSWIFQLAMFIWRYRSKRDIIMAN